MAIDTISERTGRSTGGVILMRLDDGDSLAASAILQPGNGGDGEEGDELSAEVPTGAESMVAGETLGGAEDDDVDEDDEDDDDVDDEAEEEEDDSDEAVEDDDVEDDDGQPAS
jgi:hypothetical protein